MPLNANVFLKSYLDWLIPLRMSQIKNDVQLLSLMFEVLYPDPCLLKLSWLSVALRARNQPISIWLMLSEAYLRTD